MKIGRPPKKSCFNFKRCKIQLDTDLQVFDIVLNGDHTIVKGLDIYDRVGHRVAHNEYISFSVSRGRLYYNDEESDIRGGKIRVEFIRGYRDNPKINAIYVAKAKVEDRPKLPPLPEVEGG